MLSRLRICLGVLGLTAAAGLTLAAPAANAGVLVSSATNCADQVYEQPFLPWADVATYVLAPGGTIEGGTAAWSLTGAAGAVSGNEPYYVHGGGEATSLALPTGSSATTGSMCVGIYHPTLRLFARNSGSILSTLKVEVLFEDAAGNPHSLTLGLLPAGASWRPTVPLPIVVNLLPLLPGDMTAVAFRFTPQGGSGHWQIDDVYVDPHRSH